MSRREDEFKHRTSIFEGAFRAWSHLGGLEPEELELKPAKDLDPINSPLHSDSRPSVNKGAKATNADGSPRRDFPYEPLPRSGLGHPFVKAVLSPWLGPDADNETVELGLGTLRTWWQHRRKGENKTSIRALGTDNMRVIVDKFTSHFFELAHCLVVNDKVQPPRSLQMKIKRQGSLRGDGADDRVDAFGLDASLNAESNNFLSPLERVFAAQQHGNGEMSAQDNLIGTISVKGKCIPGKIDLPGMVDAVKRKTTHLTHRGASGLAELSSNENEYGDPKLTPVVFINRDGTTQIVLKVDGITCAHCVKIVETVLKGCNGGKSPIAGLLDAAADRDLSTVLVRIDETKNAKRIAFEAARNLSMVGYKAEPQEISLPTPNPSNIDLAGLNQIFCRLAQACPYNYFDWAAPCACPDSGVYRGNCSRHSQMNSVMFDAFTMQENRVSQFINSNSFNGMDPGPMKPIPMEPVPIAYETASARETMVHDRQPDLNQEFDMHSNVPLDFDAYIASSTAANAAMSAEMEPLPLPPHFSNGNLPPPPIRDERRFRESFTSTMSGVSALAFDAWENLGGMDFDDESNAESSSPAQQSQPQYQYEI